SLSRLRHIAAPGADHHALAGGAHLDAAETGRARGWIVPQAVLELQLGGDAVRRLLQAGEVAHGEADASGHPGVAGQELAAGGGRRRPLAPRVTLRGGVVEG